MKILYFDTETTGLDPAKNDIIQIAGIIEINGEVKDEFEYKCQPFSYENVSQEALDVHGMQLDELKTFQAPQDMYYDLQSLFSKYINRYNRNDKFMVAGQNVRFDIDFLSQFFQKNGDRYLGSFIQWFPLDLLTLAVAAKYKGLINPDNFKLETLARELGVCEEFKAHDALEDIRVTRESIQKVLEFVKK